MSNVIASWIVFLVIGEFIIEYVDPKRKPECFKQKTRYILVCKTHRTTWKYSIDHIALK